MSGSQSDVPAKPVGGLAEPLHLQRLYKCLRLNPLLDYVQSIISKPISESEEDSEDDEETRHCLQRWNNKADLYSWPSVQKKRRWVCDALQHSSDSDSDSLQSYCRKKRSTFARKNRYGPQTEDLDSDNQNKADSDEDSDDEMVAEVDIGEGKEIKKESQIEDDNDDEFSYSSNEDKTLANIKEEHVDEETVETSDLGKCESKISTQHNIRQLLYKGVVQDSFVKTSHISDDAVSAEVAKPLIKIECDGTDSDSNEEEPAEIDADGTDDSDEQTDDNSEDGDDTDDDSDTDDKMSSDEEGQGAVTTESVNVESEESTLSKCQSSHRSRIDAMLREYLLRKNYAMSYRMENWNKDGGDETGDVTVGRRSFLFYGAGLMANTDRYSEHQRYLALSRRSRVNGHVRRAPTHVGTGGVLGEDRRGRNDGAGAQQQSYDASVKVEDPSYDEQSVVDQNTDSMLSFGDDCDESPLLGGAGDLNKIRTRPGGVKRERKGRKLDAQTLAIRRHKLWLGMARKEVVRSQRSHAAAHKELLHNCKRVAAAATKAFRQRALQSQKIVKDKLWLLKRLSRSMQTEWKKFDRIVKEQNKRAEREAEEQRKMDKEIMEAKRQQRKVNFLITLPELYAHFMQNKMEGVDSSGGKASAADDDHTSAAILRQLEDAQPGGQDDYDCEALKAQALQTAQEAVRTQQSLLNKYGCSAPGSGGEPGKREYPQPNAFMGQLKSYQLKGMNWIANLYYFGINGILADEMGLGKTVQAIAFLAHICEEYDTWGPFLIVTPASTLHNWTAEINRFVPEFKVVPYWGNPDERKSLRKFFDGKTSSDRCSASFHVVVTSYHIVIQDFKFLNRLKWNYMVLDEAQAIKSINSQRWKLLLGFSCRNRLLLSGTPIQNTMAELWALLHFIMPALFDSHQWFNEWFSKDIEGHVENRTTVDEKHLNRLHTILKPFMLRRIKTEVENELTDKIEVMVYCPLTLRQKFLYSGLKNKISIEELLHSSSSSSAAATQAAVTTSLMNLVMQFRKVCNHPELLERREVQSPLLWQPEVLLVPRVVHALSRDVDTGMAHIVHNALCPMVPHNIHDRLHGADDHSSHSHSNAWSESWSFAALCGGVGVAEVSRVLRGDALTQWLLLHTYLYHTNLLARHGELWGRNVGGAGVGAPCGRPGAAVSLLLPRRCYTSHVFSPLVFCSYSSSVYSHEQHVVHRMPESAAHRANRLNKAKTPRIEEVFSTVTDAPIKEEGLEGAGVGATIERHVSITPLPCLGSPPHGRISPKKGHSSPKKSSKMKSPSWSAFSEDACLAGSSGTLRSPLQRPSIVRHCQPTLLPSFLTHICPKVVCCRRRLYCFHHGMREWPAQRHREVNDVISALQRGVEAAITNPSTNMVPRLPPVHPPEAGGLDALPASVAGWSNILIPDKHSLMMDAGKLYVLDSLLSRMKTAGNRVLIYSQMTKMINLLEDYMRHRQHKYMRLDGSSKISDRRDMVADFQSKSDIFVFLLSTRAGGVGINLTAADTVIFYDSDWNPTVDQQAMDRAHRVGQTKQVTVYRLICKGTIEERILQRAKEKSEIQRMVISGGNFKPDTLKPKEVVSLLLDDDIEQQFRARQHERRALDEQRVEYNREKMRKRYAEKKLERVQQEVKRRRVDDDPTDVCGSPALSPSGSSASEEASSTTVMCGEEASSDGTVTSVMDGATAGEGPGVSATAAAAAGVAAGGAAGVSAVKGGVGATALQQTVSPVPNTSVRGHRKRGRPRMSTLRGRGGLGRGAAAAVAATDGLSAPPPVVKRGRGRPRLLPLGPGHQGQRPLQSLPAALGALQPRSGDDVPHSS